MKFSWMTIADDEIGEKEVPGLNHNPRIIEYHSETTLRATTDEVPWCSSFVNWVMKRAGYTPTRSAAARSWATWGVECKPTAGCIVVLTRNGGGHVGFYVRETARYVFLLGGNQSNAVNIAAYPKTRVIGYRMPKQMNDEDRGLYELITKGEKKWP
jgi:uncharacterized protein (TIGR02594 family)